MTAAASLDPVRLDDQAGAREAGDCRGERRQMHMAAEHDIGPPLKRLQTTAPTA